MNSKLKPKIRFKGFTDDWEQRKLSDNLKNIQTGTNLLGSVDNLGTPLLKMGNIQRGYFTTDKLEYLKDYTSIEKENIANFGDFFFNTRNTLELVGKGATWFGIGGKYAFNSNIARFTFEGINTTFFNYLYNTELLLKQVHSRATGTTSVAAIYPQSLNTIEYMLPTYDEQSKIGELLLDLDNLITLHQRKCDKLVELKKSLLEKMFPQNNSVIPEIRFKGFTDDWEQRKLNQFSKYITSNKTVSDIVIDGKYDLYDANSIIGKINKDVIKEEYITIIKDGSGVGKVRRLPKNTLFIGTMGGIVSMNSNIDFIYCNLLKTDFTKEINGATIPHVYYSSYGNNEYYIPKIEEQNKIGMIFNNIDNLITLHQRKHDKLNKIKQSLLNDMFV